MEILDGVTQGFAVAMTPENLVYVLAGVLIGMLIGVLPGLGPTATVALLLPLTYVIPPSAAIIMLAGIYYGAQYGGTVTAVLLRIPGEASAVVTTIDGYPLAQQGKAGKALGVAAIGSFTGGIIATLALILLAPAFASVALQFGPPEFFVLTAVGLILVAYLGSGTFGKNLLSVSLGLALATVGIDTVSGSTRFTFGEVQLSEGIDFVALTMGVFGLGEILYNLRTRTEGAPDLTVGKTLPTRRDLGLVKWPIIRGAATGTGIGVLPGGSGVMAALASYGLEKRFSRERDTFGRGALGGVAAPETSNNAAATSSFIPLLTFGIPANGVLALIFGALLIQGITPGPRLMDDHPDVFWGVVCSMFIGNAMLLGLNLPLIRLFVKVTRIPGAILGMVTVVIVMLGVYSVNASVFLMWVAVACGLLGYALRRLDIDPGPLVLAFVLGPIMEQALRQSLILSDGSATIFITRPWPLVMLGLLGVVVLGSTVLRRARREQVNSKIANKESVHE